MSDISERLLAKTIEDCDCMLWQHGCSNGHPAARVDGKPMMVRRVVWSEQHGEIPAGRIIRMTCCSARCVNPEHMELTTYQKLGKQLGAMGVMSGPVRSAAIARTKRQTQGKLTDAAVRDIRTSGETGVSMAQRYGVTQAHVSSIRLHKVRREFSSPFNGLGARL